MSSYTGADTDAVVLTVPIPDDGKKIDAADVNVPFGALLDNDAFFAARVGAYRMIEIVGFTNGDPSETDASYCTWNSSSYANGSADVHAFATCAVGDILDITTSIILTIASGDSGQLQVVIDDGTAGAYVEPSGGRSSVAAGETRIRVSLSCIRVIQHAGTREIRIRAKSSASHNIDAIGPGAVIVRHLRSNA